MKTKSTFSLFLLLISVALIGQPTITYNGNAPQIGDIYYFSNSEDMLDPGPSGANQTWDYSMMNVISTNQATIMNPNNTPFASDFPGCNLVFHFDGTSTYIYSDLTQSMVNHYGEGFDEEPPMIIYFSDPDKEMEYPFSFNNNFIDDFFSSYVYEGMTTHRSGTTTVTADAWGSVTTPENTYSNVLRTKTEKTQVDSVWFDGTYMYSSTTSFTSYSWHTASSHTPVMALGIIESDFGTSYASHYTTSSQHVFNPTAGLSDFQISPNPATNQVQISFSSSENNHLQISVIDLMGREVIRKDYNSAIKGKQVVFIQLNDIEAGLYFVQVNTGNKKISKKLVVN